MIKINKNITAAIFAHMTLFSYTQAMELNLTDNDYVGSIWNYVPVAKPTTLKDMAPEVKILILEAEQTRIDALQKCYKGMQDSFDNVKKEHDARSQYLKTVAYIASNPNNLMSRKNRLQYLLGDVYFERRKPIIKSMIEDGIDPNEIYSDIYVLHKNPLDDSIALNDLDFTSYLLSHGARPHYEDLCIGGIKLMYERVCKNAMLKNLFLKYKIMFYKKDFDYITPDWENIPVKDLTESLLNLINAFKTRKDTTNFVIGVIHSPMLNLTVDTGTIDAIKNAGFEVIQSDEDTTCLKKIIWPQCLKSNLLSQQHRL